MCVYDNNVDDVRKLYTDDMIQLEKSVGALENTVAEIERQLAQERDAQRQLREEAMASATVQHEYLQGVLQRIPAYVPKGVSTAEHHPQQARPTKRDLKKKIAGMASTSHDTPTGEQIKRTAPRRFISEDEFMSVSSYMRGRLTAEKVNGALDELATYAETNAALVRAAKQNKTSGYDRKHAMWLMTNVAHHPSVKGKMWALEADCKAGRHLRMDNTGRSIIMVLRHVSRLNEVRIPVDGTTHLVYVLME